MTAYSENTRVVLNAALAGTTNRWGSTRTLGTVRSPGGHQLAPVAIDGGIVAEQIAEQRCRPLRVGGCDHHARDRAGAVGMGLPFGPPHEVRRQMLAEIDAADSDLVRIEAGGAKSRVTRRAVERDGAGEGLHRQDRKARLLCLSMDLVGI